MGFRQLEVHGNVSPVGWDAPTNLTHDDWKQIGVRIKEADKSFNWFIADWLNAYPGEWGSMYDEAMELTGFGSDRLKELKTVSSSVQLSVRTDKLSITHHKHVAKFRDEPEKQKHWLDLAEQNGWSARALNEAIAEDERPKIVEPEQNTMPDNERMTTIAPSVKTNKPSKPKSKPKIIEPEIQLSDTEIEILERHIKYDPDVKDVQEFFEFYGMDMASVTAIMEAHDTGEKVKNNEIKIEKILAEVVLLDNGEIAVMFDQVENVFPDHDEKNIFFGGTDDRYYVSVFPEWEYNRKIHLVAKYNSPADKIGQRQAQEKEQGDNGEA